MSLHQSNRTHTRRRRFAFTIFLTLALGAGLAMRPGAGHAADTAPPASATPALSDIVLARSALAAIDADRGLRDVNLVVSVVNGVAVIGGPVPNTGIAKRAEQVIRQVEGVKDVRNTCFVTGGPDPLLKAIADRAGSTLPPRPVLTDLPGILTNQAPPVSPFPPNLTAAATLPGSGERVALRPSQPTAGATNPLGAPVGPVGTNPPAPASVSNPGTLTGSSTTGVMAAVAEVRRSEPRFARLTAEFRNGVLVIGGSAPLASDGWDFGQKLGQIPGVTRVAVGAIGGK